MIQTSTKSISGQDLAKAFANCLMPNREPSSGKLWLNAVVHKLRNRLIKPLFPVIRKYFDLLDSGPYD